MTAAQACLADGMLEAFTQMEGQLERIQKSLEDYLEVKRQAFPRFYFLSSADLLDILGQARDPTNVQGHLKKCFEGEACHAMPRSWPGTGQPCSDSAAGKMDAVCISLRCGR